jgi:hypothetical protein
MLNSAQMNTEKVLHVQEDSYFSRSSKQSSSRSQFDEEHSPVTPPTEELEENAWTESPQIFTAVDQDSKPLVVAIGVGYVGSHLISSIRVRLITRFSDSTSPKNASKRSQRSTEKGKQFVSQREFCRCGDDETASWAVGSDKTPRRWHVSRVKTPKP